MRTTLTLEDDVAFGLRKVKESSPEKPFKKIVNEVLRRGLKEVPDKPKKPFKVKPFNLGLRKDLNFNNIEEVLDILEGVNRR